MVGGWRNSARRDSLGPLRTNAEIADQRADTTAGDTPQRALTIGATEIVRHEDRGAQQGGGHGDGLRSRDR